MKHIHVELTKLPVTRKNEVMRLLGIKSDRTFYSMINGQSQISPAAKKVFCEVYKLDPSEIDWNDEPKPIA